MSSTALPRPLCRCRKRQVSPGHASCASCRHEARRRSARRRQSLKDRAYAAYGGYRCVCCGDTWRDGLQLDHVNNDGASHRREMGDPNGKHILEWLSQNNYPPGLLCVTCAVCNVSKRRHGYCRCAEAGRRVVCEFPRPRHDPDVIPPIDEEPPHAFLVATADALDVRQSPPHGPTLGGAYPRHEETPREGQEGLVP